MKLHEIKQSIKEITDICQNKLKLHGYTVLSDGTVDVDANIRINGGTFKKLPVKFNKITGNFALDNCGQLETLEGCPNIVTGEFAVKLCSSLTSLEHSPDEVQFYSCLYNSEIQNLQHISKIIRSGIEVTGCENIKSLIGLPEIFHGDITLHKLKIESLKYLPKKIFGSLQLTNLAIKSLQYCSEYLEKDLYLAFDEESPLKSFDYLPHTIKRKLYIDLGVFPKDFPKLNPLFDIHGIKQVQYALDETLTQILNKWLPTQNIAKAQQELEKAGYGDLLD